MTFEKSYPIKTVLLVQDLEFGGSQRYALHLLEHLDRELFDLELWVLRKGDDMAPMAMATGQKVVYLTRDSRVTPRALSRLYSRLKKERPAILYTISPVPGIWGRLFGRIIGIPVIVSSQRGYRGQQYESLLWFLSDLIIANAEALKKSIVKIHGVDPNRIAVIPNGVDNDYYAPDGRPGDLHPTIVYVGRLVKEKDPLNLLRAFKQVLEKISEARLIVVGDGYLKGRFLRFIESNSLGEYVTHIAGTRDVRPYLSRAWVYALPSRSEGFPNAVLEAMSMGLPVVVPMAGGAAEPVQAGVTGLVVPARDPAALAEALVRILSDAELRNEMGLKGRERAVRHYSLRQIVKLTENALLKTAGKC
ncbi:MAG: glycosyltransferase [Syntrophobacteraceae bacterium]